MEAYICIIPVYYRQFAYICLKNHTDRVNLRFIYVKFVHNAHDTASYAIYNLVRCGTICTQPLGYFKHQNIVKIYKHLLHYCYFKHRSWLIKHMARFKNN